MRSANYFSLLSVENTKMWKRISSLIMILILIVISVGYCALAKFIVSYSKNNNIPGTENVTYTDNWKQQLSSEIESLNKQLEKSESSNASTMEKSQIGSTKKQIAEYQFMIDNNIKPKNNVSGLFTEDQSIWSGITDIEKNFSPNFAVLAALFAIIVCSAAIAGEFSQGTMKTMVCRPYSRSQILSAKLIVSLLYALLAIIVSIVTAFVAHGILFGFGGLGAKELFWTGSRVLWIPAVLKMLIVFGLDYLQVVFYVSLALLLSVLTRSRAFATGISLLLLFIGSGIFETLAIFFPWGKFIPFSTTNFSSFILNGTTIYGTSLGFALILSAVYFAAFLFAGFFTFAKRDIN